MASGSGSGSGSSGSGNGDLAWIGGVVLLAVMAPKLTGWAKGKLDEAMGSEVAARVTELLPLVVGVLVVLAAVLVQRAVVGRVRKRRRGTLAAVVGDALPKSWEPTGPALLVRWVPFTWRIRRVIVTYPAESDDRDPVWRAGLVGLVAYRAGMEAWDSQWSPEKLRVVVRATKPEPEPEVSVVDRHRAAQKVRVHSLLEGFFGTDLTVDIPEWLTEENATAEDRARPGREPIPEGGYPAKIELSYPPLTRDASDIWRRRLEAVVSMKVPPGDARWVGTYKTAQDRIILKHRPPLPTGLLHPGPSAWSGTEGIVLPYGVDESKRQTAWALTGKIAKGRPVVHTLVIGATGTGKTSVFRSLIVGATCQGVHVLNGDPKRVELTPFRGWPGVHAVASKVEDIALLIQAVHDLMEFRNEIGEVNGVEPDDFETVLVFLDELLILRSALKRWWAVHKSGAEAEWGTKTGSDHPANELLTNLIVLARTANIRLAFGVQRPDANLFDDGSRDSVQHRISMGRLSQEGAKMLWGDPLTGTDTPMIAGRAVAAPDGGTPVEAQMYWTPDPRTKDPAEAALMAELRAVAAAAFEDRGVPEGLDLSGLSELALSKQMPGGPPIVEPVPDAELEEHAEVTTQAVFADGLVKGDRIVEDGELWMVVDVDQAPNPDEPELLDYLAITFEGSYGQRVEEAPADARYERVVEALELVAATR